MKLQKIALSLCFVVAAGTTISLFWQQAALLSILLTGLVFLKHKILPIEKEFLWFIVAGILGAVSESAVIFVSGVWNYTNPHLINIPLWLPFLWGLAGTVGVTLYKNL
jgi:hypothetical protein